MRRVLLKEMDGKESEAFIPESADELQSQLANTRKQKFKEHLYMAFLSLGIISFSIGIFMSIKRFNGN